MRAIAFAAVCLLTGCLARPHLDKQMFAFATPPTATLKAAAGGRVLGLRSVEVAEPFEGRSFVYRSGESSYDRDPYAEFMAPPEEELVSPVCSWLRGTGIFSAVEETGSALKPNTLLEVHVTQLYGDFRPGESASAVLAVRFEFFDAPHGVPGKALLQREYASKVVLKERTAVALMAGWNEGLAQILDSTGSDLERLNANGQKP
ncbi:MAG TPA: ABC-type transport auxiliary lipoprotein family protein [Candidatus Cybelea sp.]|nr:ABC-type transport auxiliary lipoprotein family protein [Candidatus Cybelea sp.]